MRSGCLTRKVTPRLSPYRDDDRPSRPSSARSPLSSRLGAGGRIALWGTAHFCFYLVQQVAELAAPVLLVLGAGWWALPHLLGMASHGAASVDTASADSGQVHDMLATASHAIPASIDLGGHVFTAGGLIFDGILLMALAAACSTVAAIAAREI